MPTQHFGLATFFETKRKLLIEYNSKAKKKKYFV